MKTLFFCNLIPLKTGAFENLLAAIGCEFRKAGNEFVVVFAGEPILPVAESLRAAGVRWHILSEWTSGPEEENTPHLNPLPQGERKDGNQGKRLPLHPLPLRERAGVRGEIDVPLRERAGVRGSTPERVRPWGFVLPAVKLIRQERPDVVAVHFGNELPTLVASLICKISMRRPPRWVWEQDQQIQDPGRVSRWFSKLRLLGLGVDRYLAVYEGGRQSMLKRGIPQEKIAVIHNSVALYTPTREKGWLRRELGAVGSVQCAVCRSEAQVAADVSAAVIESDNKENTFAGTSNATLRCPAHLSHLTSHVSPPPAILLVTNGSLIPRKRIDFILKACGQLGKRPQTIDHRPLTIDLGEENTPHPSPLPQGERKDGNQGPTPSPLRGEGWGEGDLERAGVRDASRSESNVYGLMSMVSLPPWRLLIIGEGPEKQRLTAMAAELGISDRVHFLGLRNDVREILPECDIYLHASKAETCTYAVTESMAAGIPAVMLNAGAAKEQIENGKSGFVFDEVDPVPFAECLRELMVDPVRRAEMGREAKSRWEALFRVERAAGRYHELYKSGAKVRDSVVGGG